MTSSARYETLVACLPHLPRFDRAERLPLNRERLEARLHMLAEDDAAELAAAVGILEGRAAPPPASADALVAAWSALYITAHEPALRTLLAFHADVRTVLAALRARRLHQPPPAPGPPPFGRWERHIAAHWDDPLFKLAPVFPWIGEARTHLEAGAVPALQGLLAELEWRLLERLGEADPFRFSAVVAYRFQWGLLQRWLACDEARGHARFEHLIGEVRGEHPGSHS